MMAPEETVLSTALDAEGRLEILALALYMQVPEERLLAFLTL